MLLIAMEESRQKSYAEVANVLYGTRAGIMVDVTIAMYNFGVLVSYVSTLALLLCSGAIQLVLQSGHQLSSYAHSRGFSFIKF